MLIRHFMPFQQEGNQQVISIALLLLLAKPLLFHATASTIKTSGHETKIFNAREILSFLPPESLYISNLDIKTNMRWKNGHLRKSDYSK